MELVRVFPIIIALVLITASSNISFKSGNDVNPGINTKAPLIDSILLYIDDKSTFSSLLQTISAQEQEEAEQVEEEEDGKDSDGVIKGEEQQDEKEDKESESSIGQDQEQEDSGDEQQKQDEIKEDCGQRKHFDYELGSCIPDVEKKEVCDDDRDNDNDGRVDLEDSDCLPNKNEQEQQQDNKDEQEDKGKAPKKEEEASLDNKENKSSGENPVPIEQQQENKTSSSGSFDTEDKAQNSQNLTDNHSTGTRSTNNNASLNEFRYANASAAEDNSFTLKCEPEGAEMLPGEVGSITCTIENTAPKPIMLVLECSGLQNTGIECSINGGQQPTETALIKEMSHTNFSVVIISHSSPPVPAGSYPFTIRAEECINSDLC